MFNQTAFNVTPFNRPYTLDVLFSVHMDGEGALFALPSVTYTASIVMGGEGSVDANYIREITKAAFMNGEGALSATNLRERILQATINGDGSLTAQAKKYHVDSVTVEGPFAPGDKIIFDSTKFRITKNGTIIGYDGELFDINPGVNTITYQDSETGRNIVVRVSFRDRYLY